MFLCLSRFWTTCSEKTVMLSQLMTWSFKNQWLALGIFECLDLSVMKNKQTKTWPPKTKHFPYSRGWSACHTHIEEDLSPAAHSFLIFLLGRPPGNTQPWHSRGKAVWRILKPLQMAVAEARLPVHSHNKLSDQTLIFGKEVEVIFFRVPSTPQYNSR